MKIFLNLLAATAGGQLSRARAFLDRFHEFAPQAKLIILKEASVLSEYTSNEKREVINIPLGFGRLKALRRMCWENFIMPGVIQESGADVYLTFSHYLPSLKKISIPSVVGVSNLAPFSTEAWSHESWRVKLKMALLRKTIISSVERASSVLALSEACRAVLISEGIAAEKIQVASNGVDSYWSLSVLNNNLLNHLSITKPFVLYVSHFHRYKNYARLVKAYAALPLELRKAHQLVLVGQPQNLSCYQEIKSLIESLGLKDEVLLISGLNSEELRVLYQKTKLFVFASLIENSPNILLEAMMSGSPIMTSRLAPMPEFCGDAALYFDALNVQDISEKLQSLLSDPDKLVELAKAARIQASQFSWDNFVTRVVRQLEACHS